MKDVDGFSNWTDLRFSVARGVSDWDIMNAIMVRKKRKCDGCREAESVRKNTPELEDERPADSPHSGIQVGNLLPGQPAGIAPEKILGQPAEKRNGDVFTGARPDHHVGVTGPLHQFRIEDVQQFQGLAPGLSHLGH